MKLQNMYIGSAMSKNGCLHLTTVSKKGSHKAWLWKATRFIMCVGLSPLSTIFCLIVFVHNDISIAVCLSVSQHVLYMSFRLQAPISHHSRKDSENPSHTVGSHQQASEMWQVWGQHPECGLSGWYIRCSVSFYCILFLLEIFSTFTHLKYLSFAGYLRSSCDEVEELG